MNIMLHCSFCEENRSQKNTPMVILYKLNWILRHWLYNGIMVAGSKKFYIGKTSDTR